MNKIILIRYSKSFSFIYYFFTKFWMILPLIFETIVKSFISKSEPLNSSWLQFFLRLWRFQIIENLNFKNYTTRLFNDFPAVISIYIM